MPDQRKIQELAGAAGYLCSAYEELSMAGYNGWSRELKALIDIIGAEIDWLSSTMPRSRA